MNAPLTRILIVEDNGDDAALLMRQLKKADLDSQIRTFADGGEALDYLKDEQTNSENLAVVFLDLKLPTVTGIQLLEFIRAEERIRHLRVVVMTSFNPPDMMERCAALKASFVPKPVTFTSFVKAVADTFHAPSLT